jgi:murein hydrolase activator
MRPTPYNSRTLTPPFAWDGPPASTLLRGASPRRTRKRDKVLATVVIVLIAAIPIAAQSPRQDAESRRVSERIRALQREAEQLASQSKTLLVDLQRLEVERNLRTEEAKQAEAAAAAAEQSLLTTAARLTVLEQQRDAQLPDLRRQLVDIYKRGRTGYAQLLFGADNVKDLSRATRAVASLSTVNERRVAQHRATLEALRGERKALEEQTRELRTRQQQAADARTAAQRAVASRTALLARIDSRRDLAAQYAGELQDAYDRLRQQLATQRPTRVEVPLAPFRGALDWPVTIGRVTSRFGQTGGPGGAAVRNGIDIATLDGAPVHAVHGGTVAFAGQFTGFGTLVIVDHGANNFTLYGYLSSVAVDRGAIVDAGAELGRTGSGPGAGSGLYFEVRIDGRQVDPLQWLKPR